METVSRRHSWPFLPVLVIELVNPSKHLQTAPRHPKAIMANLSCRSHFVLALTGENDQATDCLMIS